MTVDAETVLTRIIADRADSPLQPLAGKWVTTITMLHPPELKGQVFHALDAYHFLGGGQVMVHEVHGRMPDGPVRGIEIYTPADGGGYVSRNFDSSGQISDYAARMTADGWRIQGETERYASTRLDADVIEGLWRLKDGDGWVDWMSVRMDRVA